MNCPYCNEELVAGRLFGHTGRFNDPMKWMPNDKKLVAGLWFPHDSIPVGDPGPAAASLCPKCKKLILDLDYPDNWSKWTAEKAEQYNEQ